GPQRPDRDRRGWAAHRVLDVVALLRPARRGPRRTGSGRLRHDVVAPVLRVGLRALRRVRLGGGSRRRHRRRRRRGRSPRRDLLPGRDPDGGDPGGPVPVERLGVAPWHSEPNAHPPGDPPGGAAAGGARRGRRARARPRAPPRRPGGGGRPAGLRRPPRRHLAVIGCSRAGRSLMATVARGATVSDAVEPSDIVPTLMAPSKPHVIVLFGATGDLARRKLLPGLLRLSQAGLLPESRIIGTSLDDIDVDAFRKVARAAYEEFGRQPATDEELADFESTLDYVPQDRGPGGLAAAVGRAERELGGKPRLLHYLSVPPGAAKDVVRTLGEAGLNEDARIIMEKPFGWDLASAKALNASLHQTFNEDQIFRIDHFLGKEAALNIL